MVREVKKRRRDGLCPKCGLLPKKGKKAYCQPCMRAWGREWQQRLSKKYRDALYARTHFNNHMNWLGRKKQPCLVCGRTLVWAYHMELEELKAHLPLVVSKGMLWVRKGQQRGVLWLCPKHHREKQTLRVLNQKMKREESLRVENLRRQLGSSEQPSSAS